MTQTVAGGATPAAGSPPAYTLADRYRAGARPVLLTGVQAVARLLVEQHARDARAGLRTASLVSGYPGSPLAGLDKMLAGVPALRERARRAPGARRSTRSSAATAVWGSQLELPQGRRTHDGVVGVWYGKGPGVDRSGDALRHANLYGAHPRGGALVLAGDDPAAKSSTVPCVSERTLAALGIPVLYPRNAAEVVAFGLLGVALSRASGCWVGLKIVADVADGLFTVDEDFAALPITVPELEWEGRPWTYRQRVLASPPDSVLAEEDLVGPRWAMVQAFGAANAARRDRGRPAGRLAGHRRAGRAVRRRPAGAARPRPGRRRAAPRRHPAAAHRHAVRRSAATSSARFARGLDEMLVVEEKTPFVETQVRDLLYGTARRAAGAAASAARDGEPLVPAGGALPADRLAGAAAGVPRRPRPLPRCRRPAAAAGALARPRCSGRRTSAAAARTTARRCCPEGSLGGGRHRLPHDGDDEPARRAAQVTGVTQMGGEGAQWIGQAPFTDVPHIFQNVGDGTFFHSGQLALQACVAAGVNITYKILYNRVVAMTGAQDAQGALEVPALTRTLHAAGRARRSSSAPRSRGGTAGDADFAPGTLVWHRDRLDEAQRLLRDVPGVTVLIYDQQCAAEARRLRKRGKLPVRTTRVVINEAVCEGCGDCGVKSNCLSVQPVDTEFGRKTRIDQTSCNTDYSCLAGDCPSFLTVEARRPRTGGARRHPAGTGRARAAGRPRSAPTLRRVPRRHRRHRDRHGQRRPRHRGDARRARQRRASTRPGCRRRPAR